MQIFKTFFNITKKQLPSLLIYFSIFMVLLSVMSALGKDNNEYSDSKESVVVFNNDDSEKSKYLEEYISKKHEIVHVENDDEKIMDYLFYQIADYVLYIDEGFKLSNIKRPDSITGTYIDNQIRTFSKTYDAYIMAGYSDAEANEKTLNAIESEELVSIKGNGEGKPSIYYYYTYYTYIIVAVLINVLAPVVIALNRKEVKARADISPNTSLSRNIQIVAGTIVLSLVIWLLMVAGSVIMFGGELFSGINSLAILNSMCYMIISVAIVGIMSNFSLRAQDVSMVSTVVSLSFSFLGGVFVPMEIFSEGMLTIAKFVPTYWYVTACDDIFAGKMTNDILINMGVQMLFALAFFAIAMTVSKRNKLSRIS